MRIRIHKQIRPKKIVFTGNIEFSVARSNVSAFINHQNIIFKDEKKSSVYEFASFSILRFFSGFFFNGFSLSVKEPDLHFFLIWIHSTALDRGSINSP